MIIINSLAAVMWKAREPMTLLRGSTKEPISKDLRLREGRNRDRSKSD